jgi:hypothetical protein
MVGSYGNINEPSVFIKGGEFLISWATISFWRGILIHEVTDFIPVVNICDQDMSIRMSYLNLLHSVKCFLQGKYISTKSKLFLKSH